MAHVLNLIYSGGTVVLNSGSYRLMDYTPRTGADSDEFVTESAEIEIGGTAYANVQANIDAVERVFAQVTRWRDSRVGEPVYVSYQPDGYSAPMTSELHNARLELSPEARKRAQWGVRLPRALLIWERRNYWQGAKTQLAITNPNGAANTTGLRVYNCNDGATADTSYYRHNYFTVDGDDIAGELPAPIFLQLEGDNVAVDLGTIYISAWAGSKTQELFWEAQGEEGTQEADANSSDGYYHRYPLTTSYNPPHYVELAEIISTYSPDSPLIVGKSLVPLVRLVNAPPTGAIASVFQLGQDIFLTQTQKLSSVFRFSPTSRIQAMPTIVPKQIGFSSLSLYAKADSAGNLDIDYLMLLPSENFVEIRANEDQLTLYSYALVYDNHLVNTAHASLVIDGGLLGYATKSVPSYGAGIMLQPGQDHRFYVAVTEANGAAPIGKRHDALLYYYPRRRTL